MGDILDELLERIVAERATGSEGRSTRVTRGRTRGNTRSRLGGGIDVNVGDLGAREQYRYRLAQTAAQIGASPELVNMITQADTERLPEFEQALLSENPQQALMSTVVNFAGGDDFFQRNVGAPVGNAIGRLFDVLDRPLNAVTGAITEAERAGGGNGFIGDVDWGAVFPALGRGLARGITGEEDYSSSGAIRAAAPHNPLAAELSSRPAASAIAGFASDVVLDPLTYTRFGAVIPDRVQESRRGVQRYTEHFMEHESELQKFRQMSKNQQGQIVEDTISELFKSGNRFKDPVTGRWRTMTAEERLARQPSEVFDPALNRGIPRSPDFPTTAPKKYGERLRLTERILEENDLRRLRTGQTLKRLEDFTVSNSELARRGHFYVKFGGRTLVGDNRVSRGLYENLAGPARLFLGYNRKTGEARFLNQLFNYNRKDLGEFQDILRRAQGNYAGIGEATLHDIANLRHMVSDEEMDMIVDTLNAWDIGKQDNLASLFDELDQRPLDKSNLGEISSVIDVNSPAPQLTQLRTIGDVARQLKDHMDNITQIEKVMGLRALDEIVPVMPLKPKKNRKLTNAELRISFNELRRREIEFANPLEALADNISYRLSRLSVGEATIQTLESYALRIPDLQATTRKVRLRDSDKVVARTTQKGSQIQDAVLGDLQPVSQEILRGSNPIADTDFVDQFMDSPGANELVNQLKRETARRGRARVGNMEFVPASKVQNPIVQRWLKEQGIKNTDILLPAPIADALSTLNKFTGSPDKAIDMLRLYDRAMSGWKKAVTVYNPGYHVRNMFSDFFMNVAAGVADPLAYERALRVIRNRFEHNLDVLGEVGQDAVQLSTKAAKKGSRQFVEIAGQRLTPADVWTLYARYSGAKSGQVRAELTNILERATVKAGQGNLATRIGSAATRFSEGREDYMRLAHFIDYLDRQATSRGLVLKQNGVLTGEAQKLAQEVGDRVRFYNLDYGAKTDFERAFMSRAIPFYTYLRRNLPLQVQLLFTQPGVIARYPRYLQLFEGLVGNPEEDDSTVLIPKWVQQSFPWLLETESRRQSGPLGMLLSAFGVNDEGGAAVMPLSNMLPIGSLTELSPILDPLAEGRMPRFGEVQQGLRQPMSSVTPFAKIPFELAFGQNLFTGGEIRDVPEYLMSQLPVGRIGAQGLSGGASGAQDDFMRWLTGMPIRQVTPENEQSEYRRREDSLELVRERVKDGINSELRALGMPEIDQLPNLDPDELITAILISAQNRGQPGIMSNAVQSSLERRGISG